MKKCGHHADLICGCGLREPAFTSGGLFDWTSRPWSEVGTQVILVDSVAYTAPRVRQIVQERHTLAEENADLRAEVERLLARGASLEADLRQANLWSWELKARAEAAEEENVQQRPRIERLLEQLRRNETHLHRRTAALVRLIARRQQLERLLKHRRLTDDAPVRRIRVKPQPRTFRMP